MLSLDFIIITQKIFQMGKKFDIVDGEMKGNYIIELLLYYKHLMGNFKISSSLTLTTTFLGF